jgi:hypothetical protein
MTQMLVLVDGTVDKGGSPLWMLSPILSPTSSPTADFQPHQIFISMSVDGKDAELKVYNRVTNMLEKDNSNLEMCCD